MKSNASHREHTELVVGRLYTAVGACWVYSDIWRALNQEWAASVGQVFRYSRSWTHSVGEKLVEPPTPILLLGVEIDHFKILVEEKIWFLNSNALLNPLIVVKV